MSYSHCVEETPCALVLGVNFGFQSACLASLSAHIFWMVWILGTNLASSKITPGLCLSSWVCWRPGTRPVLMPRLIGHRRCLDGWLDHLPSLCGGTWDIKKGVMFTLFSTNGYNSRESVGTNSLGLPYSLFRWSKNN